MLQGKKYLVVGVANDKSIAWGIAQALHRDGAKVALTYVNDSILKRLRPLAESIDCDVLLPCDVQSDEQLDALFVELKKQWGSIDGLVHSVAFARKEELAGRFVETTRAGFQVALDVSAYSFLALAGRAASMMEPGGSLLTLSYLGANRVVPYYNVMGVAKAALEAIVRYLASDLGESGIRVNAISAGPLKTLAASGIPHFRELLAKFAGAAPLQRNVTLEDVANAAVFLLSPYASGITGEVTFVDCGYNCIGAS